MALQIPERQPFLLGIIGQSLEMLGDPDASVFMEREDSFWTGVPVGFDEPLPRVPAVFPKKERIKPLDDSEYCNIADNYKSARGMAEELEQKFREEEKLGRMNTGRLQGALSWASPACGSDGSHKEAEW